VYWSGTIQKAQKDEKGTPHILFLSTGPRLDKASERMREEAISKYEAAAKAGKVFLTPGHDVALPLAKSVDAIRDDTGQLIVDIGFDPADPLGMSVYNKIESKEWEPQVSIGAEKCTRMPVWDPALSKSVMEIVDIDTDQPVHLALCFPGRAMYPVAGVVQALTKAMKGDAAELAKRGWSKEALEKAASPGGEYIPPTFAERFTQQEFAEELPDLLKTLQYTLEDILSPWSGGDKPALLAQTFGEFAAAVGQEIDEAGGDAGNLSGAAEAGGLAAAATGSDLEKAGKKPYGDVTYADPGYQDDKVKRYPVDTEKHIRAAWSYINKPANQKAYSADQVSKIKAKIVAAWKAKIDKEGPPAAKAEEPPEGLRKDTPPDPTPPDPPPDGGGGLQKFITEGLTALEARLTTRVDALAEGLTKAAQAPPAGTVTPVPPVEPVAKAAPAAPPVPDTAPAKVPHTGLVEDNQGVSKEQAVAKTKQELQAKAAELRKAIDDEPNRMRRDNMTQEYNALQAKISRM
jgi:hypothetical protein